MPLTKPTLTFEIGLIAGVRDPVAMVGWTDITPWVRSWSTARGRQPTVPPAHFDPGTASLLLDNRDRRFDPTNTASPYSPNLQPARVRLRITANWPNLLSANQASIERDASEWAATGNCSLARSTAFALDGTASLRMTSIAGGAMFASTPTGLNGRRVRAGDTYTAIGSVRAGVATGNASVSIAWYDESGAFISNSTGGAISPVTTGFTQAFVTAAAPAGAAYAALVPAMIPAAGGENHYWDCFALQPGTSTAWTAPYPVFCGYIKRWPPKWTAASVSEVEITAVDALGAPLNLPQLAATMWQTVVRHDKPKVWLRLGESSGTVAADSTPNRLDGQYQGSPVLGLDSVLTTDADKAVGTVSGSRVSLPYKNLVTYPFTFEIWFRVASDRSVAKMILSAYDGAAPTWRQAVQVMIGPTAFGADAGKIIAVITNPYPTGTQSKTAVTVDDGARHHLVMVCASATSMRLWVDGQDQTVVTVAAAHDFPNNLVSGYGVGNNASAPFGEWPVAAANGSDAIDEAIFYDYALSGDRIIKHFDAGAWPPLLGESSGARVLRLLEEGDWPTATDADIDNGQSSLQMVTSAASLVANLQAVETSEQGALFVDEAGTVVFHGRHAVLHPPLSVSQATFGQGAGDLPYEAPVTWGNDDAELFNEASGSRAGGKSFTEADPLSQGEFGERPLAAVDGLLNTGDGEVVDLLRYRVTKYARSRPTIRQIRLHPAAVPALYPYVLGLGLRSRITVEAAPPGGGPVFSQECHIEHSGHEVDDKGDWWTTLDLSAADTATYLILDDAARGVLDAGNLVAF